MNTQEFHSRLRAVGEARYHHRHPFHLRMHEGTLTRAQLQAWALNRYAYQARIPIKDALILARATDPGFRVAWRKRIVDHDGDGQSPGGIEKWIRLAEATGLNRGIVMSESEVLPGVRYAVEAYLDLVTQRTFFEAVASSLTEMFSRDLISLRIDALKRHYPWLSSGLEYFTARLTQAPEDVEFALGWVTKQATTDELKLKAIAALEEKCAILWAQLDALYYAYVEPGHCPPGAFCPGSI
ncbi:MAG: pyrroloquinoline-quinone synthase PqqC [Bdellovibrionales bacterium]|nr:pyrroloquinoline-quinone synthase PqqC [Bdellovibrionales bacterium]